MNILCSISNLSISFGTKTILDQTGLTIYQGDKIGLLGLNGSGKSTLLKVLTGEVTPDQTMPPFLYDRSKDKKGNKYQCFHVPQELVEEQLSLTALQLLDYFHPKIKKLKDRLDFVNTQINEQESPPESLFNEQQTLIEKWSALDGDLIEREFLSCTKYFKIEKLDTPLSSLSGGEQKKVLLAIGFSSPAEIILWDEPTNHLDLETILLLEGELLQSKKSMVIISHDRYLLSKVTTKIFNLHRGQLESYQGSYYDFLVYLEEKEKEQKQLLGKLKNRLKREDAWMKQGIKARGTRSKKRVENFNQLMEKVQTIKGLTKKNLELNLVSSDRKTKVLVHGKNISLSYPKMETPLFSNFEFQISKKNKIGIIGPNGCGKTSLINIILEKQIASTGSIKIADDLNIKYFSQQKDDLNPEDTPYQILGDGTDTIILPDNRSMHVAGYFESFLFNRNDLHRPIKTFSGGEKSRLQMAKNLTSSADFWIFDEPTNDLDLETINILEDKLHSFDGPVFLVSHDRAFLDRVVNQVWFFDNGKIEIFTGGYSQVEQYIEARTLEQQLLNEENKSSSTKKDQISHQVNNTQPKADKIKSDIQSAEKILDDLDKQMNKFDFNTIDPEKSKRYQELSDIKEKIEEKLLLLYEEKEQMGIE